MGLRGTYHMHMSFFLPFSGQGHFGVIDLLLFKVVLGSVSALVSKLPLTRNWLAVAHAKHKVKRVKYGTQG